MILRRELARIIAPSLCPDMRTYRDFTRRLEGTTLIRSENPRSHFCVYFLPYHETSNQVFLVYHKKAAQWIFPGGHIEAEETLADAVRREIREELGIQTITNSPVPFLCTRTYISDPQRACRYHYDIWHILPLRSQNVVPDMREFAKVRWIDIGKAGSLVTDANTLMALVKLSIMQDTKALLTHPMQMPYVYA